MTNDDVTFYYPHHLLTTKMIGTKMKFFSFYKTKLKKNLKDENVKLHILEERKSYLIVY